MTNPIIYPNHQYQKYPSNYSGVTINVTNPMMNAYPNVTSAYPQNCNCDYCQSTYIKQYPEHVNIVPQNINNHYAQYPQPQHIEATRHYEPKTAQIQDPQYIGVTRHYQPETTYNQDPQYREVAKPYQSELITNSEQYIQTNKPAEVSYVPIQTQQTEIAHDQPQLVQSQPQTIQAQPAQSQQAYPAQYYLNNYNILPGGVNNNGENNGTISTVSNSYPEQTTPKNVGLNENPQPNYYNQPEEINHKKELSKESSFIM